jgi:hypothetical protein
MRTTVIIAFLFASIMLFVPFSCNKESSLERFIAKGTLKDVTGNCMTEIVHGNFYNGIVLTDSNYIEVKIDVQKTGSYIIHSNTANGFMFADSGTFNSTGLTTIKLKPAGIPLTHSLTNFNVIFDTSICTFSVDVKDSALLHQSMDTVPVNNWQFTEVATGIVHKGSLDTNYIYILGLQKMLVLSTKEAKQQNDSTLLINIILPNGVIEKGNYSTDDAPNGIVFKTFDEACLNCAGGGLIPRSTGATVIFTITNYNNSTKIVTGTFSGTTLDKNEKIAPIAYGQFSALMQ